MAEYPKRPKFFAHKFCRLLGHVCAAHEIGPETCYLLTQIAHCEDSKHYSNGVTYWSEQLQLIAGMSKTGLWRATKRAVAAGWLHYEPGTKRRPSRYWVTIPPRYEGVPDTELGADMWFQSETELPKETQADTGTMDFNLKPNAERLRNRMRNACETECGTLAKPNAESIQPYPDPSPDPFPGPDPKKGASAPCGLDGHGEGRRVTEADMQDVVDAWNAYATDHARIKTVRVLTDGRRGKLRTRLRDRFWTANYREAIQHADFNRPDFAWRPDFDWFIRNDTNLVKLLEGEYDQRPAGAVPFHTRCTQEGVDEFLRGGQERQAIFGVVGNDRA